VQDKKVVRQTNARSSKFLAERLRRNVLPDGETLSTRP